MTTRIILTPSGAELPVHHVDGHNFTRYERTEDFARHLQLIKEMEVRSDDIFVGGYPKSGNHWVFEIVHMILRQSTEIEKTRMYNVTPEFSSSEELQTKFPKLPSPRVMQYHIPFDRFPTQLLEKKPYVVYIARNPKDVMVSAFNFFKGLKDTYKFKGTWDDIFQMSMSGEFPPGSWCQHVLDAERFFREHPEMPVHVIIYEKLKENTATEIRKLCQFLEKPDVMVEKIAEAVTFNKFKTNMQKEKMAEIEALRFEKDSGGVLRKGVVGDWQNWFTPEQNKTYDKFYVDKMKDSPIGDCLRGYI